MRKTFRVSKSLFFSLSSKSAFETSSPEKKSALKTPQPKFLLSRPPTRSTFTDGPLVRRRDFELLSSSFFARREESGGPFHQSRQKVSLFLSGAISGLS